MEDREGTPHIISGCLDCGTCHARSDQFSLDQGPPFCRTFHISECGEEPSNQGPSGAYAIISISSISTAVLASTLVIIEIAHGRNNGTIGHETPVSDYPIYHSFRDRHVGVG